MPEQSMIFNVEQPIVTITQERFEKLLNIETRVNVLVDFVRHHGYIHQHEIYMLLGYMDDYYKVMEEKNNG